MTIRKKSDFDSIVEEKIRHSAVRAKDKAIELRKTHSIEQHRYYFAAAIAKPLRCTYTRATKNQRQFFTTFHMFKLNDQQSFIFLSIVIICVRKKAARCSICAKL